MSLPKPTISIDVPVPALPSGAPRRIRVLHFHSSKGLYGPERWTHLALRTLAGSEVDQAVLTIGTKPGYEDFAQFLRRDGYVAHHLALGGKFGVGHVRAIRNLLVAERVDVLHTHGFKTDVLGYLATRNMPIGLVTTPHGWCDHESFRIRMYETIGRWFLRGFDRVYPLSDHQLAVLQPYGLGSRVRRIRNAVDIEAFDAIYAERKIAAPHAPMLLFVGRIAREKGLFDLLEAAAIVAQRHQFRIVVAGEGPGITEAHAIAERTGIADRTTFTGFVEDIRPFLRDATALALPSYSEGIPRVVMEAFAAGVAVVGTEIPGLRELVEPGRSGLLVPVGDVTALAAAVETLFCDGAANRRMTEHARAAVERDYSPRRLADELRDEYARLAPPRPGDRP